MLFDPCRPVNRQFRKQFISHHLLMHTSDPNCRMTPLLISRTYPAVYMPHHTSKGERSHTAIGLKEATARPQDLVILMEGVPLTMAGGIQKLLQAPTHMASPSKITSCFVSHPAQLSSAQQYLYTKVFHLTPNQTCLNTQTPSSPPSTKPPQRSPCLPSSSRSSTSRPKSLTSEMRTSDMPTRRLWVLSASSFRRSASLWL